MKLQAHTHFFSDAAKNQVTPEIRRQCLMKLASVCSIGETAEPIRQKVEELKAFQISIIMVRSGGNFEFSRNN